MKTRREGEGEREGERGREGENAEQDTGIWSLTPQPISTMKIRKKKELVTFVTFLRLNQAHDGSIWRTHTAVSTIDLVSRS